MEIYSAFRSLLFKLDPETAHDLTLRALSLSGWVPPIQFLLTKYFSTPGKPVELFGLKFKNPVGLAAGYDKDGTAFYGLSSLGFGHIEIGTVTPRPQSGNIVPRVFRLVEDESIINRMGFPSRGTEFVQSRLNPALVGGLWEWISGIPLMKNRKNTPRTRNFILGVNLGKNKETPNEEAVFDYLSLLQNYASLADYLTINVSSPNTVGLRSLQGRDALHALLTQLHAQRLAEQVKLNKNLPLLVKLAPDLSQKELEDAVGVIIDTGMDGVIVTNTTLSRPDLQSNHKDQAGGLSGKAVRTLSDDVLTRVVKLSAGRIPVVGAGGIMTSDDAQRKMDIGASLVQLYTGLIFNGPGLVKQIVEKLK